MASTSCGDAKTVLGGKLKSSSYMALVERKNNDERVPIVVLIIVQCCPAHV
jgi:hypothetical protein